MDLDGSALCCSSNIIRGLTGSLTSFLMQVRFEFRLYDGISYANPKDCGGASAGCTIFRYCLNFGFRGFFSSNECGLSVENRNALFGY